MQKTSKRLQKELKNLNQDLSLSEAQNLFSKVLGFNHFHELKTIINNNSLLKSNNLKPVIFIISNRDIIHKSIFLFLHPNYECIVFHNIETARKYLNNPQNNKFPNIIINDTEEYFTYKNTPIILLTINSKADSFEKNMELLFLENHNEQLIIELKNYINHYRGNVLRKYWYMLMMAYKLTHNEEKFQYTALQFSHLFNLPWPIFNNFFYSLDKNENNCYYLSKPFSKEDLHSLLNIVLK